MQTFSTENLPEGDWREYRKVALTSMVRIDGPFTVETSEGPLHCADGFLAVDARGYPYPIAADEQALIYEPEEHELHTLSGECWCGPEVVHYADEA